MRCHTLFTFFMAYTNGFNMYNVCIPLVLLMHNKLYQYIGTHIRFNVCLLYF